MLGYSITITLMSSIHSPKQEKHTLNLLNLFISFFHILLLFNPHQMAGFSTDMAMYNKRVQRAQYKLDEYITHGNLNGVQNLVTEHVCLVSEFDSEGNLPLHRAAIMGHSDVACYLTRLYPQAAVVSNLAGETPIYAAIINNHFHLVKQMLPLLQPTISLYQAPGKSLVHAVLNRPNWQENVEVLFGHEKKLMESRNERGLSPLSWAIYYGHEQMANHLSTRFPELMEVNDQDDSESLYPIHQALKAAKINVIRAFYNNNKSSIYKPNRLSQNILHMAAKNSNYCKPEIIHFFKDLPELNHLLSMQDNKRLTPVDWAHKKNNAIFLHIF